MAFSLKLPSINLSSTPASFPPLNALNNKVSTSLWFPSQLIITVGTSRGSIRASYRSCQAAEDEEEDGDGVDECGDTVSFQEAVVLFNMGEFYKCHDVLEDIWMKAEEPTRTLVHGILQCAVGFHHLFNENHKGAMMELGEGICKLRKMDFGSGPFHEFEKDNSAVHEFIYQTQIELAAYTDDMCMQMDQSERSYQLLGGYAAGQRLYYLQDDSHGVAHIVFRPQRSYASDIGPIKVKLPVLNATHDHLLTFQFS